MAWRVVGFVLSAGAVVLGCAFLLWRLVLATRGHDSGDGRGHRRLWLTATIVWTLLWVPVLVVTAPGPWRVGFSGALHRLEPVIGVYWFLFAAYYAWLLWSRQPPTGVFEHNPVAYRRLLAGMVVLGGALGVLYFIQSIFLGR